MSPPYKALRSRLERGPILLDAPVGAELVRRGVRWRKHRRRCGWSRYATPIRNLYLCGSGSHPGGGVMGAPGHNAAKVILAGADRG